MGNSSGSVVHGWLPSGLSTTKTGTVKTWQYKHRKPLQSFHRTTIFCLICCYSRHLFVNETTPHTHFIFTLHTTKTNVLHARWILVYDTGLSYTLSKGIMLRFYFILLIVVVFLCIVYLGFIDYFSRYSVYYHLFYLENYSISLRGKPGLFT